MSERNRVERIWTKVTKHLIILTIRVPFYFNWITPKTMFRFGAHLLNAPACYYCCRHHRCVVTSNATPAAVGAIVVVLVLPRTTYSFSINYFAMTLVRFKGQTHCACSTTWTWIGFRNNWNGKTQTIKCRVNDGISAKFPRHRTSPSFSCQAWMERKKLSDSPRYCGKSHIFCQTHFNCKHQK